MKLKESVFFLKGYYSALYPILCEIFAEETQCSRVPKQSDLESVILKHGATKMTLKKLHAMHNLSGTVSGDILEENTKYNANIIIPDIQEAHNEIDAKHLATISGDYKEIKKHQHKYSETISFDYDNPNAKPRYFVTIKYKKFTVFWKWFKECCQIIKELAHLWDANDQSAFQCNLFCGREECQQILNQAPQGTFILRLSSVIKGGVVLSYCEPSYHKKDKHFKHTVLIRRKMNQYELRSHSKSGKNNLTSISALSRSFVKIKFLYTPNNIYPKKNVF